jgi:hypothetical protein
MPRSLKLVLAVLLLAALGMGGAMAYFILRMPPPAGVMDRCSPGVSGRLARMGQLV